MVLQPTSFCKNRAALPKLEEGLILELMADGKEIPLVPTPNGVSRQAGSTKFNTPKVLAQNDLFHPA